VNCKKLKTMIILPLTEQCLLQFFAMNFSLSRFVHIKHFYCIIWQFFTIISFKIIHERQLCVTSRAMGNFCSIIFFLYFSKEGKTQSHLVMISNYSSKWLSEFSSMKSGRLLIWQRDGLRHCTSRDTHHYTTEEALAYFKNVCCDCFAGILSRNRPWGI
jgi:hypothetical protein